MAGTEKQLQKRHLQMISDAVSALDDREAIRWVKHAQSIGESSLEIVRAAEQGMHGVGQRYEDQEFFLAGLIMAGEIFRSVMELVLAGLEGEIIGDGTGRVLLGTVAGDIHDIGKDLVGLVFRANGFTVKDLGVNVSPERFLEATRTFSPDIVGMSGLLSGAFTAMRSTVQLLKEHASELDPVPVTIIGGETIDDQVARYVGADYWTIDAIEGVHICQRIMESRQRPVAIPRLMPLPTEG